LSGPVNCELTSNSSPYQFFSLIFTNDLIENIKNWTNQRAKEKIDNFVRRKQEKSLWNDITSDEMRSFIRCILTMGILKLPSLQMYWDTKSKLFSIQE